MNQEVLILTGMSGAGRSTVAHALEDLGYAWFKSDEGNVVSLSITDYPSF